MFKRTKIFLMTLGVATLLSSSVSAYEVSTKYSQSTKSVELAVAINSDFTIENGTLVKYNGSGGDIVIPDGVTSIGDYAFVDPSNKNHDDDYEGKIKSSITSITLPSTLTSIGRGAFLNCNSIKSIVIPDGVKSIGGGAFAYCLNLTNVTIPSTVTNIGGGAFAATPWLKSQSDNFVVVGDSILIKYNGKESNVVIPDNIKRIGECAFWYAKVTSITIPNSVTSIGNNAFGNTDISSIVIPNGVTSIGKEAFFQCNKLTSVTIPNSVKTIDESAFEFCRSLTSITIPDGVTRIGLRAFADCYNLTDINIPKSVTNIGGAAFEQTPWLDNNKNKFIMAGDNILVKYNGKESNVVIPKDTTSIAQGAFSNNETLVSVTIPNSLTNIGGGAFQSCSNLTNVNIPDSVKSIDRGAFGFTKITKITIPSSVISIGEDVFKGCTGLTITGKTNSYAEIYAKNNNIAFVSNGVVSEISETNSQTTSTISKVRLGGADRYGTAVAISKSGWKQSNDVILASGESYNDALVGSSFAYLKNAPVLITYSDKLNSSVSAEIERLQAKNVYILGSEATISENIYNELKQKYNVVRIGGTGLYDTAVNVGDEIRKVKQFDTVVIAPEGDFPDALAIAPFSAMNTMPILFSNRDSLRTDTMTAIQKWDIKNAVIVGGTGVVSDTIDSQLKSLGINVTRLAGQDRYDTSLEIIKHFEPSQGYKSIAVASGESYPDALTGAELAAKNNIPLVLVGKDSVKANVSEYIGNHLIDSVYIFGGNAVVPDKVLDK
ncbi:leucine-rich repeat protein [Clostridium sp. CX1]|uniref:leucine-rich repeat protein n=1 Tax=Clostridium sp. CX1 TaxID=2978346 RepID=UPI0021C1CEF4|nr:leucine-rich repeat protein [Clostridium sp. CX1]MCT8974980.1 leucine-rich repeat protein [Clostridium sp. CX1]